MNRSAVLRAKWVEFLYIWRAIFSVAIVQGGSLPFFGNCIMETER